MRGMLEKILSCYGKSLEIHCADGVKCVRAFLQPVTGRAENMSAIENSPLGKREKWQYVYIGPVEPAVEEGDMLECPEGKFLLRRCERVDGIGGPAYRWGMCVRKGAEDTWGLNG